ncbi:MAG TPA: hypothetical protein VG757_02905 [Devosia sp.]|nr:hypothetical protein [Devosia sp.]
MAGMMLACTATSSGLAVALASCWVLLLAGAGAKRLPMEQAESPMAAKATAEKRIIDNCPETLN